MWGQTWSNVADLALPYSGVEDEDLTLELVKQVSKIVANNDGMHFSHVFAISISSIFYDFKTVS